MSNKIKVIKQAYHRNGVGGAPFGVIVFEEEGRNMLGVVFDDPNTFCAVFDLDLLGDKVIEFGENSWRGDTYHYALSEIMRKEYPDFGVR